MAPTKLQRWLDLIAFLVARQFPVTIDQLMEGVPGYAAAYRDADKTRRRSTRRTFERDKAELRDAGIPIETVQYTINYGSEQTEGYRLARQDFLLPYLRILGDETDGDAPSGDAVHSGSSSPGEFPIRTEELRTVLEGLDHVRRIPSSPFSAAGTSALRKLTFDLPVGFPEPPMTLYLDPPGGPDPRATVRALANALLQRKRVDFRYHGIQRASTTDRGVDPYGLMFRQSRWYLVGRDHLRDDIRVFRVSRMENVRPNTSRPETPDYDVPPDFDLGAYEAREAWQLGRGGERPLKARVLFRFPRSLWAERNSHGTLVERRDDGSCVREFEVTDTGAFLRWLLPQARDAVVQLPAELGEQLRRLAARVAEAHTGAPT